MPNDRVIVNPNFKDNGDFHRSLMARGKGAKDYPNSHTEVEYLGNGKFAASIGVGHRVFFDKADGDKPKKHKLTDNRPDYVLIQSAKCCVEVYPYYAKYFDVQHEEVRLHEERWVVQRLFKSPDTWRDVDAYNPQIAVEEYPEPAGDVVKVTVTYDTDYGTLTVEYFQRDGNALKHNVYFTNTSGSTETFRVVQKWAGIVGAKVNGKDFPLDTDESFLAFRKADGKLAVAENLGSMIFNPDGSEKTDQCLKKPIKIEAHTQGMKADFIYGNWTLAQNESLEIDPDTATLDDPTVDGKIQYRGGTTYRRYDALSSIQFNGEDVPDSKAPRTRAYVEWDVSSILDGSTITETIFKYNGVTHGGADAEIRAMASQPSVQSDDNAGNQIIFDDIGDGTIYDSPAGFAEEGTGKEANLGAVADSDLESALANSWFAIGIKFPNDDTDIASAYILAEEATEPDADPPPTLYVEYTVAVEHEKTLTESLGLADKVVKAPSLIKTELLGLSDTLVKEPGKVLSESLGLVDVHSRTWGAYRVYSEILGLSDTVVKAPALIKTESLGLLDSIAITKALHKVLSELLGLSDTVKKDATKVLTEDIGLVDTYSRTWAIYRTYSELLGLVDAVAKMPSKTFPEALGLSDTVVKTASIVKTEMLGLTDTYSRTWGIYRTYTELLGLADSIRKDPAKILPEALSLLDSVAKSSFITKSELLGLKDSIVKETSVTRTELLGLADTLTKDVALPLSEVLGLLDTVTKSASIIKIESLGLEDRVSKHPSKALTEVLGLLDSIAYTPNPTILAKLIRKYLQLVDIGGGGEV